jgi:ubiquinone/menaquinone biosynthesis C-methylase UbiE
VTIRAEYDRAAADYDRRWARYNRASLELLPFGQVEHDLGRVLDVGCGTGNLLAFLAEAGFRMKEYVGVDLSPEMLRIARSKPCHVPASWITADAASLPLRDASFDTAISASALHYWDDAGAGLAEIRRVLWPGGRLLLLDWVRDPLPMRLLNAWMRITRVRYRRMYSRAELVDALARAGFDVRMEAKGSAGGLWRLMAFEARVV